MDVWTELLSFSVILIWNSITTATRVHHCGAASNLEAGFTNFLLSVFGLKGEAKMSDNLNKHFLSEHLQEYLDDLVPTLILELIPCDCNTKKIACWK